jgi:hypothetical protein
MHRLNAWAQHSVQTNILVFNPISLSRYQQLRSRRAHNITLAHLNQILIKTSKNIKSYPPTSNLILIICNELQSQKNKTMYILISNVEIDHPD